MADSRILHRKLSGSSKVSSLSHLEFRVWIEYVLWADDCGIMRASVSVLRANNPNLENEPKKRLEAAMGQIEACHLVSSFIHQGQRFWWQRDWQDYQQIRYPRAITNPLPPSDVRVGASTQTEKLFRELEKRLRKDSAESPHPAHAGGRETLTPTQTPTQTQELEPTKRSEKIEVLEPVWRKNGPDQHRGLVDTHRPCFVSPACERGLCVPGWLVTREWMPQVNGDHLKIHFFIERVLADTPHGPVGDDKLKFWKAQWLAHHGSQAPVTHAGKGHRAADAFRQGAALVANRQEPS